MTARESQSDVTRRSPIDSFIDYLTGPRIHVVRPQRYGSRSYASSVGKRMEIAEDHLRDILLLASVLVHEACHFYQYDDPTKRLWFRSEREEECYTTQLEVVEEIDPTSRPMVHLRHSHPARHRLSSS